MSTVTQSDLDEATRGLAERYVASMEKGDAQGFLELFAPEGSVWLSYAGTAMSAQQNADLLAQLFAQAVDEFAYDDIRWSRTAKGFLQQHVLKVRAKSGATFETGGCVVLEIAGGRISRTFEYVDSSIAKFAVENGLAML